MNAVFFGVVLLQILTPALGYGTGAPTEACGNMKPGHKGIVPQTSQSPYSIQVSNTTFTSGKPITVTIIGPDYGGVLLQARSGTNTDALGSWGSPPNNTKYLTCSKNSKGAITHSSPDMKNNLVYTWIPPASYSNIYFVATVAKDKAVYWLDVRSANLTRDGPGSGADPESVVTPGLLMITLLISTVLQK
ncbi:putative defense protein 3 [Astyanax mexicanus]|uniref:putative defense protein 3 n=1 Tax=Astyanax mexicanus TaxID=7994 RepID=UPI0020CACA5A|nr:putative defense protein 3 [Astyanax mexicanus]